MKWLRKIFNSRLFEDIADNFDPYSQDVERFLAIEKLKSLERQQGERNDPMEEHR